MFTTFNRAGSVSTRVEMLEPRQMLHAGSPDLSFGVGGTVRPTLPEADVQLLARQSDGKLLVAGSVQATHTGFDSKIYLARYLTDGHLDASFGSSGRVNTKIAKNESEFPLSVTLDGNGKIFVLARRANVSTNQPISSVLLRYSSSGKLDTSFGNKGVLTVPSPTGTPKTNWERVTILSNAKILLAGQAVLSDKNANVELMRLSASGAVDSSFGDAAHHSVVTTDFGGFDEPKTLLIQSDGKIVLACRSADISNDFLIDYHCAAARFSADGKLDTTFATGGKAKLIVGQLNAAALAPGGAILLAGSSSKGTNDDFAVLRLSSAGKVDTSFGKNGASLVDFAGDQPGYAQDGALAIGVDPNGKIVLGGAASFFPGSSFSTFATARLSSTGQLDKTYSGDGKATTQVGNLSSNIAAALVEPDGKVVLGETAEDVGAVLVRFNTSGSLDNSFGRNGRAIDDPNGRWGAFATVQIQSDGKILAAGETPNINGTSDVLLARFNPDGSDDKTFGGGDGRVVVDLGGIENAEKLHVLADGRILVVASRYTNTGGLGSAVLRFNKNGSLDSTFGGDGILTRLPIVVKDAVTQSNGKIFLAGQSAIDFGLWAVARLSSSGVVDRAFGKNGVSMIDFNHGSETDGGEAVAIVTQKDGKLVVGGIAQYDEPGRNFALARYNVDGSLDKNFGTGGSTQVPLPSESTGPLDQVLNALALAPDGKIVAGGLNVIGPVIARFTSTGKLDSTFGSGGAVALKNEAGSVISVAVQSNGKIVATGNDQRSFGDDSSFLERLTSKGVLDSSFGTGGAVDQLSGGDMSGDFTAVTLQADGKIVIAGAADKDLLVRRFLAA